MLNKKIFTMNKLNIKTEFPLKNRSNRCSVTVISCSKTLEFVCYRYEIASSAKIFLFRIDLLTYRIN